MHWAIQRKIPGFDTPHRALLKDSGSIYVTYVSAVVSTRLGSFGDKKNMSIRMCIF